MISHGDLRVLVVDEFSTMRRVVRGLLRQLGCVGVEEADDGVTALAALKAGRFDLVVSAVNLPGLNGIELLRAIKADDTLRRLPVLIVTAEARKEDIVLAAQAGAAGYIVKPFTRATLEDKVQMILHRLAPAA